MKNDVVSREVFQKETEALRAQIEQLKLEKARLEGMLEEARRHQTWPITFPQPQPYTISWGKPIDTTNSGKNIVGAL